MNDLPAKLRLIARLDAPSDCGGLTVPCTTFDGVCYEAWTNTDCNNAVDGADVLPILMYLIEQPL